jgi:hypothetical protein
MPLNKVNADSIADGTVIASDIADGTITLAKLQSGLLPSAISNSAASYANAAFATANTGTASGSYANSAFSTANSAFAEADSAASYANSGFAVANSGFVAANSAGAYANSSFSKANNALTAAANTTTNVQFGSFGVGTAASGTTGEIRATNNITAYYSSDKRYKKNVINIQNPLEKLQQINGVEFDWTEEYMSQHGGEDGYFIREHDIGVIAQEIEAILPEIVATREDGYKAVKYDRIVALLIEAIKELKSQIDELKNKE